MSNEQTITRWQRRFRCFSTGSLLKSESNDFRNETDTMNQPRHIVAVAGLVTNAEDRILMIRGPRRGWEFPGGQVEEGESLIDALKREIDEETGIQVEVGKLVGVYSNLKAHIVVCDFLCTPISGLSLSGVL
jgi:ADP-ribose pyrophosphatase YjhB (NUDIX family)